MAFRSNGKTEIDHYVIRKVIEMRTERQLSQSVLATKMNVSNAFIGTVENPKKAKKYNLAHLNKLAEIFGCSPKDFLPEHALKEVITNSGVK